MSKGMPSPTTPARTTCSQCGTELPQPTQEARDLAAEIGVLTIRHKDPVALLLETEKLQEDTRRLGVLIDKILGGGKK